MPGACGAATLFRTTSRRDRKEGLAHETPPHHRSGGAVVARRRLAGALGALIAAIVVSLLIADLLHTGAGQAAPAAPGKIQMPTAPEFPSPPDGALVFAREDGANALALAVLPKGRHLSLQASVVGPDARGVGGLSLGFAVSTRTGRVSRAVGASCGAGCYAAGVAAGSPRRITVTISRERRRFEFVLPRAWPPADATALVRRSGRVWRNLRALVSHERLASDPRHAIRTVYRLVAPDRLGYEIAGGSAAVVIGNRRWDRASSTSSWQRSSQHPPLTQPLPFWSGVRDAHIVASPSVRGRRVWRITFFDPQTPAWFTVLLDRRTLRTLDLRMVTAAHFMHDVYGPFNQPLRLRPPR
jgi:hypothetical protein